eukprot:1717850-Alexandrium_andersonii.AAC.1
MAVGGMRLPHLSVQHVPRAAHFQSLVRPVLFEHLSSAPGLKEYTRELIAGRAPTRKDPPPGLGGRALGE